MLAASRTATCGPRTSCPRSPTCSASEMPWRIDGESVFDPRTDPVERRSSTCARAAGSGSRCRSSSAHPGFARPQDQSIRRTWRVARPVRDRPPSRADRADGQLAATCALQRGHRLTRRLLLGEAALRLPARPTDRHDPADGRTTPRPCGRAERPHRRGRPKLQASRQRRRAFSIMLPEGAFREGRNSVELLSVTRDPDAPALSLIAQAG